MRRALILLALASTLVAIVAIAAETIHGAGATFPYPLYSAWAYDYGAKTQTQLNYQSIGSGGGIQQIENRTVDFGASDEPLTSDRLNKSKLIQFPAVIGGVVLAVNTDKTKEIKLDNETLCGIFLGQIQFWDDPKLKTHNPHLPRSPITVVFRSDGSGTTAIFSHYLAQVCPEWKTKVGEGKSIRFPSGIGAKGNEGVANVVKRTAHAIGYLEYAYAKQNNMQTAMLKNASGHFVSPSLATFQAAAQSASFESGNAFYAWLTNAAGDDAWPIAGATFILLAKEKSNRNVIAFFDWAFAHGDEKAQALHYVPLPAPLKSKIKDYWKAHGL